MTRLMSDAGIRPTVTQVRSGDAELSRITGAQAPRASPSAAARPSPTTAPARRHTVPRPGHPLRRRVAPGDRGEQTAEARKAARVRRAA